MTNRIKQIDHLIYFLIEKYVDVNSGTLYLNCHFYKELIQQLKITSLYGFGQNEGVELYNVAGNIFKIMDLNIGKHVWAFKTSDGKFYRSGDMYKGQLDNEH